MTMHDAPIPIIYQDHHLLIVNKPAGIVVHPTYKHVGDTMWDRILSYVEQEGGDDWQPPELPDEPEWAGAPPHIQVMLRERRRERLWQEEGLLPRPSLLHRIDKDTSGIVALARTERARKHIIRQFHDHTIVKRYIAVVRRGAYEWSRPRTPFTMQGTDGVTTTLGNEDIAFSAGDEFVLDGPIQRDPLDRRRCIIGPEGQEATTQVRALVTSATREFILLEARPITGRIHQIRVHLVGLGYAIVGDRVYAPPADPGTPADMLDRQFLHAHSLTLRRYPDNALCTFVAPLAHDLVSWLQSYFPTAFGVIHDDSSIPA